ncbi:acyl-CoA dehydrogenase family protein [Nocardia brevicatena]|uniref:acyl-CoA dehydrogenase family protein n=1 Tax=Nocardia brevicatena TaxID=37327 RepID=UPI000301A829|nr:acyl-CoA dehydrogenase family protein [Nocardia brevicatena]
MGAGCTGIIQGRSEAAVDYSGRRRQFGRPPASFQLIQDMIAEISTDCAAAPLLIGRAETGVSAFP